MTGRHYIIACGGTGGHLSPGIAVAEGLVDRGHGVTLLISHKKVDTRLVEKYPHLSFLRVPGAPFSVSPLKLARFLVHQTKGMRFSLRLVREKKPAGIVGFGGFTSSSIILAGAYRKVPVFLHEANRVPGRAIRSLGRFASRVYLPPGVTLKEVAERKIRPMGLPVRREIQREDVVAAREQLHLQPDAPVISILGGSQGATALNQWARDQAAGFARLGVQTYIVTGLGKGETSVETHRSDAGRAVNVVVSPFCDRMATLLSATTLAVTRAGAGTLAELVRCGTPAILVPYPHAADNHQAANADYFALQGGGVVVGQDELSRLTRVTQDLLLDEVRLGDMRASLGQMDRSQSLADMLDDIEEVTIARPGVTP